MIPKHIVQAALLLCFLAATLLFSSCPHKGKTIDVTPGNSLEWLSVYQITQEDSATIVSGNLYGRKGNKVTIPSDVYLRGGGSGTEYQLLQNLESPAGKTVTIPENMTLPFTLVFEPLQENDTSFDLVCGKESVRGINLSPEKSKYTTTISGTLIDRPNTTRLLLKAVGADVRVAPYISIPVKEGEFSYQLHTDEALVYDLICWDEIINRAYYNTVIFSDGGRIEIKILPFGDDTPPEVTKATSAMNKEYQNYCTDLATRFHKDEYLAEEDSLYSNKLFYTKEYMALLDSIKTAEHPQEIKQRIYAMMQSGENLTDAGKAFVAKTDSISKELRRYIVEYNREKPGMVGYYLLYDRYSQEEDSTFKAMYREVFQSLYEKQYPDHPLTAQMFNMIAADNIKPGGRFIDFTAPDLEGKNHTLSEEISGKIAVIDLWASWCGPCRKQSVELIPIYNKYKGEHFTIVGVAREHENTLAMSAAIQKDGYPWLNLVELNDANRIWQKYGVNYAGGRILLVAADGRIVAMDPSAEQIQQYLEEKIGLI